MRSGAGDEKLDPHDASNHVESAVYVAAIALVGLAYRATFITQGFNATDEGWLPRVRPHQQLAQLAPCRDGSLLDRVLGGRSIREHHSASR
jgi:hypothetical protein